MHGTMSDIPMSAWHASKIINQSSQLALLSKYGMRGHISSACLHAYEADIRFTCLWTVTSWVPQA